ncbi:MAG: radical SAM protein [Rhodospirillaceae bacterium]|jgi:Fe-coproporphyrin III synthase|nr:radical SAM protein [Rhodospirillaceae bacterium]MBT4488414.1 radical SAM protein [Rhodospirillaceae bacterium]MBT5193010.1 radical SAM protein [Rhodospirillaceae bacterium]MBT5894773.1 radical SAM protein [Rhodospirillaceae bacterium]MBT6431102.1 radical SAM protein [Rhodospirillaceae bacterium]
MQNAIYSSLKAMHYHHSLDAMQAGDLPAPVHVRIKPTNVCNHNCYFCAYRTDDVSLGEDMVVRDRIPREKMLEIVDDLIAMNVRAVTFSGGGEPLLYPYFVETVERLAAGGIKMASLTNGSRLKGKVADALAAHGTWIRVSIDGWDGPSYGEYRSVDEGVFEAVMTNLTEFSARRSECVLGASIIVDHRNAPHIYELTKRLKETGVAHAKVSPCIIANSGAENNAYHDDFKDVVKAQIQKAKDLDDSDFHVVDHYHGMEIDFSKPYQNCAFAQMLTVIGADCKVYTCQDKAYTESGTLGDISNRGFREFWFSDENRDRLAAIDPNRSCQHHCVADAKNRLLDDYLSLAPDHLAFI